MDILVGLSPYLLIGLCLLILLMLVALFVVVRAMRSKPKTGVSHDAAPEVDNDTSQATSALAMKPYGSPLHLRRSFAHAAKLLRANLAGKDVRYQIPWHVMIGETGSGKTTLLGQTGLSLPLGTPKEEQRGMKAGCTWWFFDDGVVLDLTGDYVLRANATSDVRGWHTFLRLLQKYRFKRPIEGVILTIPATELIGPKKRSAERLNQATHKAAYLYKQLWQAQKILGMRFPVYILVTKCDQISGFHSFCGELPVRTQHEIFGWSNPYSLENAYAPHWADEAFERLYAALCQIQIEVMADGLQVRDSDGFFLFPTTFQAMFEPLRMYLDQIFKPSVYHESFFFRGLYFCGDSQLEEHVQPGFVEATVDGEPEAMATTAPNQMLSTRRKPIFLRHLFEKKIFPEHGLACPISRTFLSRNRTVLAAQLLAVFIAIVGGLGLWRDYNRLSSSKQTLHPVLEDIADDLDVVKKIQTKQLAARENISKQFETYTINLLEEMAGINTSRLSSFFIPSSWFSSFHTDIIKAITESFEEIIMNSIYDGLEKKYREVAVDNHYPNNPCLARKFEGISNNLHAEKTQEFLILNCYVSELDKLKKNIDLYNGLQNVEASSLDELGEVVQYVFNVKIPKDFYSNSGYYQKALAQVSREPMDPEKYKSQAMDMTTNLSQDVNNKLFGSNEVLIQIKSLSRQLDNFEQEHHPDHVISQFQDILDSISRMQNLLDEPAVAWLSKPSLDLGDAFAQLLTSIEQSAFLGKRLRQEIEQSWQEAFQVLRVALANQTAPHLGPLLLQEEGAVRLRLSEDVRALKSALETLFDLTFMTREPHGDMSAGHRPLSRLMWDTTLLDNALSHAERYDQFNGGLAQIPVWWTTKLRDAALYRLEATMRDLIAQARQFEPLPERLVGSRRLEDSLRPEIQNFTKALKPLNRLISTFDQAGLRDSALELSELVALQAQTLLDRTDQLLQEEALYRVQDGDFSSWHGGASPSAAFGATNVEELTYYLDRQRERLSHLSRAYAEPLIAVLTPSTNPPAHGQERLLAKWEAILAELDQYDNKKPGNSVTALETFILFDLRDITARNCLEKMMAQDPTEVAGDVFLQHRRRLWRALVRQCQTLDRNKAFGAYDQIADRFNRTLAGRFPFARNRGEEHDFEAELHAIRSFYQVFDTYGKTAKDLLTRSEDLVAVSRDQALAFLERLEAVRGLFAPFLDAKGAQQIPALDFEVDFRVNKSQEQGGHRIIDWRLAVGEQEFQHLDTERRGRWYYGDPIRFSLRWAKDAHRLPIEHQNQAEVEVKDATVTYTYTNSWSLISFLRRHTGSPGDYTYFFDPRPHTLIFRVETKPVGQEEGDSLPTEENTTKVFVRLRLISSDNQEDMIVPDFPTSAPPLQPDPSQVLSSAVDP